MHKNKLAGCLAVFLSVFVVQAWASQKSDISMSEIPYIQQSIELDGQLNDLVWKQALQVPLSYEVEPGENIPASVKTTAYIFEDGKNIYVGFNASDPEPHKIKAYLSARDNLWKSDYVGIALDTFNDSRRAFQFFTNAIGVQADLIIDEITDNEDIGWDAIWQSSGVLNDQGYTVEMKIPLKSLRFENNNNLKQWKIKFSRVWIRNVEHEFANIAEDRNNDCDLCQFAPFVGFKETTPTKNLTIVPSMTLTQSDKRNIEETGDIGAWSDGDVVDRGSLDLRWGINQNVFLNATINPDFSHVEADEIQLEVNKRFAIRTTEKRPFFLDGADYFSNWSRLVHTKLFAEPDYGLKLTGKSGNHSYGIMSLTDKDTTFLLPDNQSSRLVTLKDGDRDRASDNQIFRYRYDLGEQGNVGFTSTLRDADGYSNDMFSVDGKYWFSDSDYLKFQVMTSDSRTPTEVFKDETLPINQSIDQSGNAFSVNYNHSSRDWDLLLTHHHFGKDFRADSGFVSRSNWKSNDIVVARNWYPEDQKQWWKSFTLDAQWFTFDDLDGNQLNNAKRIGFSVTGIHQSLFGFDYLTDTQNYVEQVFFTPPSLLSKEYTIDSYEVYWDVTLIAGLDLSFSAGWGDGIDFSSGDLGDVVTIVSNIEYQLNDNWNISLEYINELLELQNNIDNEFNVHIYNMRTAYQIDVNSFIRLTLQASRESEDRDLASQLLYSYQLDPFTRFFFGYSDDGYKDSQLKSLKRTDRTLFMKFSYAWQL